VLWRKASELIENGLIFQILIRLVARDWWRNIISSLVEWRTLQKEYIGLWIWYFHPKLLMIVEGENWPPRIFTLWEGSGKSNIARLMERGW
jgi:hypothetical protein